MECSGYDTLLHVCTYIICDNNGVNNFQAGKKLYRGIESKLRYDNDVIRTELEDAENIFCRCIVTESKESGENARLVLIVPSLPLGFVDYNGNCYNRSGSYLSTYLIYNYAPYNEIADALAKEGNVVVRMDMFGKNRKPIDPVRDITAWIHRIQELKGITEDPVVIGHRESGFLAILLMKSNHWKRGILLCCGLNHSYPIYSPVAKSYCAYIQELSRDYSFIQIDAGLDEDRMDRKETTSDLHCAYRIYVIENMDYTLRYYDKRTKKNVRNYNGRAIRKGYNIRCGTEEFPPVCEELVKILNESIDLVVGAFV